MAASIIDQIKTEIEKRQKEIAALQAALAALEGTVKPASQAKASKPNAGEKKARKPWDDERRAKQAKTIAERKAQKAATAV